MIGAGPFIVIDTEVFALPQSKPEYNRFASILAIDTPEFPTLPYIRLNPDLFHRVTLSKAVDSPI